MVLTTSSLARLFERAHTSREAGGVNELAAVNGAQQCSRGVPGVIGGRQRCPWSG